MGNGREIAAGENVFVAEWTAHWTRWRTRVRAVCAERAEAIRHWLALTAAMLIVLAAASVESYGGECEASTRSDRCLQATEM